MPRFPRLSIATKLYAIFALLATATVVLALVAVVNARRHAALTDEFESALQGAQNVERINGLIYAVVMESRGIYMSEDAPSRKKYADGLLKFNDQIGQIINAWERTVGPEHADQFKPFAARIRQFIEFRKELARLGVEVSQAAGREWGDNDANRTVRIALNEDLNRLGALYAKQARDTYAKIDTGIDIHRLADEPARRDRDPARRIRCADAPAGRGPSACRDHAGDRTGRRGQRRCDSLWPTPRRDRGAGALDQRVPGRHAPQPGAQQDRAAGRRIARRASGSMCRPKLRRSRIQSSATSPSSAPSAIGCWSSATHLSEAADGAARRTEGATAASAEASANVRDIASATDELAASVMEIDRQVAQSNAIAEKAVGEAERTNAAVQELNEAAKRIGDVVSLITDIAEQTNLLALNATIEAARAGDAGRGFAVVAGEVKALAGQTAKATEDIATQIAGMQHATSRSIEAIEAIERTIRDIGSISGAIAAAVTEQGAATQEIARSVDVAAKRTHRDRRRGQPGRRRHRKHPRQCRRGAVGGGGARRRRAPHPRPGRRVLAEPARRRCRKVGPVFG